MSNQTGDGGPAFPEIMHIESAPVADLGRLIKINPVATRGGMSLRDWFAGMALQGMCANPDITKAMSENGMKPYEIRDSFASSSYAQADEMIRTRDAK